MTKLYKMERINDVIRWDDVFFDGLSFGGDDGEGITVEQTASVISQVVADTVQRFADGKTVILAHSGGVESSILHHILTQHGIVHSSVHLYTEPFITSASMLPQDVVKYAATSSEIADSATNCAAVLYGVDNLEEIYHLVLWDLLFNKHLENGTSLQDVVFVAGGFLSAICSTFSLAAQIKDPDKFLQDFIKKFYSAQESNMQNIERLSNSLGATVVLPFHSQEVVNAVAATSMDYSGLQRLEEKLFETIIPQDSIKDVPRGLFSRGSHLWEAQVSEKIVEHMFHNLQEARGINLDGMKLHELLERIWIHRQNQVLWN